MIVSDLQIMFYLKPVLMIIVFRVYHKKEDTIEEFGRNGFQASRRQDKEERWRGRYEAKPDFTQESSDSETDDEATLTSMLGKLGCDSHKTSKMSQNRPQDEPRYSFSSFSCPSRESWEAGHGCSPHLI